MSLKKISIPGVITATWTSSWYTVPVWKQFVLSFLGGVNWSNFIEFDIWIRANWGGAIMFQWKWAWAAWANTEIVRGMIFQSWDAIDVRHRDGTTSNMIFCGEEIDEDTSLKTLEATQINSSAASTWYTVPVWKKFIITNVWGSDVNFFPLNLILELTMWSDKHSIFWQLWQYKWQNGFKWIVCEAGELIQIRSSDTTTFPFSLIISWEEIDA